MYRKITIVVAIIVYTIKLCFLFGNFDEHGHLYCCNLPRNRFTKIIATNSCRYHTDIISGFFSWFSCCTNGYRVSMEFCIFQISMYLSNFYWLSYTKYAFCQRWTFEYCVRTNVTTSKTFRITCKNMRNHRKSLY